MKLGPEKQDNYTDYSNYQIRTKTTNPSPPISAEDISGEKYFVRLSNRKYYEQSSNVKMYHNKLVQLGFTYNERQNNGSFYELLCTKEQADYWKEWADHNRMRCNVFEQKYARNDEYRKTFFQNNKPAIPAKYRCAYCGRKLLFKDTTVDHIFPVNQMCYSEAVRRKARRFGIEGTNDEKNLVACCRSCNSKKGTNLGFWIYRGFLGKSETLWRIRKGARFACIIAIGMLLAVAVYKNTSSIPHFITSLN